VEGRKRANAACEQDRRQRDSGEGLAPRRIGPGNRVTSFDAARDSTGGGAFRRADAMMRA
jgi:hypothetical protein